MKMTMWVVKAVSNFISNSKKSFSRLDDVNSVKEIKIFILSHFLSPKICIKSNQAQTFSAIQLTDFEAHDVKIKKMSHLFHFFFQKIFSLVRDYDPDHDFYVKKIHFHTR